MSIPLRVPALGESVAEAMIARWYVKEGVAVSRDQALCEIESDKVNVEIPAPAAGTVVRIIKLAGDSVAVGEVIAEFEAGEGAVEAPTVAGVATTSAEPSGSVTNASVAATPAADKPSLPAGPAARRLLEQHPLPPTALQPTGPKGQLTKGDVLAALKRTTSVAPPPAAAVDMGSPAPAARDTVPPSPQIAASTPELRPEERVRLTPLRRKVARRLVQAQQTSAILTTFNECDMSAVIELRSKHQESFTARHGVKLGFMSFFVKAVLEALKAFPGLNSEMTEDEIIFKKFYDIGVAVGGGKGLVVPVVRNADQLSFAQLEKTIAALGKKARDNSLTLEELSGGTFTISNGGVYGSLMSTPILNPPQTGILGMHKIQDRPVAVNGQVVIRPMMYLAVSYDHRVIDGREAVGFLVRVKECIEAPERILLEV